MPQLVIDMLYTGIAVATVVSFLLPLKIDKKQPSYSGGDRTTVHSVFDGFQ
ncbi:hypothetical protein ACHAO8_007551 [Botrytis cinerea]